MPPKDRATSPGGGGQPQQQAEQQQTREQQTSEQQRRLQQEINDLKRRMADAQAEGASRSEMQQHSASLRMLRDQQQQLGAGDVPPPAPGGPAAPCTPPS